MTRQPGYAPAMRALSGHLASPEQRAAAAAMIAETAPSAARDVLGAGWIAPDRDEYALDVAPINATICFVAFSAIITIGLAFYGSIKVGAVVGLWLHAAGWL